MTTSTLTDQCSLVAIYFLLYFDHFGLINNSFDTKMQRYFELTMINFAANKIKQCKTITPDQKVFVSVVDLKKESVKNYYEQ